MKRCEFLAEFKLWKGVLIDKGGFAKILTACNVLLPIASISDSEDIGEFGSLASISSNFERACSIVRPSMS